MNTEDVQQHTDDPLQADEHKVVVPPRFIEETQVYEGGVVKEKVFALLGAFAVTGLIVTFTATKWHTNTNINTNSVVNTAPMVIETIPKPPRVVDPFDRVLVDAEAAVVYDVNQERILFEKNSQKKRPLASITKLMTALIAVETLKNGTHIAISPESIAVEGDSGLFANESWDVGDLIHFTMLTSSNDGANALAASVGSLWQSTPVVHDETQLIESFVKRMNFRADELGLRDTQFSNPTGLDDDEPGGLGTAEDTAKLLTYIWEHEPEALAYTNVKEKEFISLDEFVHVAENTNERVENIPGLLGGKTGYTDNAGGNLGIIYDAGLDHPIVIVVLGSTIEGRFDDVETLVDATYDHLESGWFTYETEIGGSTPQS